MKITNVTHWETRDIMRLIYRVAQDELDVGQLKRRGHVTIKYRRSNYNRLGDCHYGTPRNPMVQMRLFLPREGEVSSVQLAKVIAHEFGHAKGLRHRDMQNTRYGWVEGWKERYAYAQAFHITAKKSAVKLPREEALAKRRQASVVKATKMVRKWETSVKRANTLLKKWRSRLKAAEKRVVVHVPLGLAAAADMGDSA